MGHSKKDSKEALAKCDGNLGQAMLMLTKQLGEKKQAERDQAAEDSEGDHFMTPRHYVPKPSELMMEIDSLNRWNLNQT